MFRNLQAWAERAALQQQKRTAAAGGGAGGDGGGNDGAVPAGSRGAGASARGGRARVMVEVIANEEPRPDSDSEKQ